MISNFSSVGVIVNLFVNYVCFVYYLAYLYTMYYHEYVLVSLCLKLSDWTELISVGGEI